MRANSPDVQLQRVVRSTDSPSQRHKMGNTSTLVQLYRSLNKHSLRPKRIYSEAARRSCTTPEGARWAPRERWRENDQLYIPVFTAARRPPPYTAGYCATRARTIRAGERNIPGECATREVTRRPPRRTRFPHTRGKQPQALQPQRVRADERARNG